MGFGFKNTRGSSRKSLWITGFLVANILSLPYIMEDVLTLVAHILAFMGGYIWPFGGYIWPFGPVLTRAFEENQELIGELEESQFNGDDQVD